MTRLPQVLVNVAVAERRPDITDLVAADLAAAEAELGDHGRVLIRPSGTEPLVRVMVEAPTARPGRRPWPTASPAPSGPPPPDRQVACGGDPTRGLPPGRPISWRP